MLAVFLKVMGILDRYKYILRLGQPSEDRLRLRPSCNVLGLLNVKVTNVILKGRVAVFSWPEG